MRHFFVKRQNFLVVKVDKFDKSDTFFEKGGDTCWQRKR